MPSHRISSRYVPLAAFLITAAIPVAAEGRPPTTSEQCAPFRSGACKPLAQPFTDFSPEWQPAPPPPPDLLYAPGKKAGSLPSREDLPAAMRRPPERKSR